jgi:hypothetical protein
VLEITGPADGSTVAAERVEVWDIEGYSVGYEIQIAFDIDAREADDPLASDPSRPGERTDFVGAYVDGWCWGDPIQFEESPARYPATECGQSILYPGSGAQELGLGSYAYSEEYPAPFDFAGQHDFTLVYWGTDYSSDPTGVPVELGKDTVTFTVVAAGAFVASGDADASLSADLGLGTPSTLSTLPTAQSLEVTPAKAAATGGAAFALIAIAFYPGVLLEATLSANYDRIFGWAAPARRRVAKLAAGATSRLPRWFPVAVGFALAILISGFVDPRFGLNGGSVRVVLSLAIAMLVERLLFFWLVVRLVRRRNPEYAPEIVFHFGSLGFVVVAVLLSRLTGFEPGIVFGLVLGVSFAVELAKIQEVRLALVATGYTFALGILGWLVYSLLVGVWGPDPGFVGVFLAETFSSFAISGLAALPIALLPLAVLDGGTIWSWNRWVWAGLYLVSLFTFLTVVLPLPSSWAGIEGTLLVWIVLFVAYCLLAVGVWALFRFRLSPPERETQTP